MHRIAFAAVLAAAAGPAQAEAPTFSYETELAQAARRAATIAGGVSWTCADTRCTASGRGGNVSVKGCSELARAVGPIMRYRSEIKELPAADLRECNRVALATAGAAAKAPAKPQRATTPEIAFTGVASGGDATPAVRKR